MHRGPQDLLLGCTWHDDVGDQRTVVDVLPVVEHQAVIGVVEREAVGHHVERMGEPRPRGLGDHLELGAEIDLRVAGLDLAHRLDDGTIGQPAAADLDRLGAGRGVAERIGGARRQAGDDALDAALDFLVRHVLPPIGDLDELGQGPPCGGLGREIAAQGTIQRVAGQQHEIGIEQGQPDVRAGEDVGEFRTERPGRERVSFSGRRRRRIEICNGVRSIQVRPPVECAVMWQAGVKER